MAKKITVSLTANFERNLETIEAFLEEGDALQAYDLLLDELSDTVIANLEHYPMIGRPFLDRPVGSVEVANSLGRLQAKLQGGDLREYLFTDYLVLYAQFGNVIHLLSIRQHRQLSFDFQSLWPRN